MKAELSEESLSKIKTAMSVFDLLLNANKTISFDSIRNLSFRSFCELADVIDEIRKFASCSDEGGAE